MRQEYHFLFICMFIESATEHKTQKTSLSFCRKLKSVTSQKHLSDTKMKVIAKPYASQGNNN